MRQICLVDAHAHPARRFGQLHHGVDDAAVVLLALARGQHEQAVAELMQRVGIALLRVLRLLIPLHRGQYGVRQRVQLGGLAVHLVIYGYHYGAILDKCTQNILNVLLDVS